MFSFNPQTISSQASSEVVISNHVTVQAAAELTGYSDQYLRRMLRSGTLNGLKIGQMWLIEMQSLESYLQHAETTSDRRFGSKKFL